MIWYASHSPIVTLTFSDRVARELRMIELKEHPPNRFLGEIKRVLLRQTCRVAA